MMILNNATEKQMGRLFMEADDGSGGSGGTQNSSGDASQVIERKDPVSGQMVAIPKELEPFLGHLTSSIRSTEGDKYKGIIETLKGKETDFEEVKGAFEQLKLDNMSAEERALAKDAARTKEYETKLNASYEERDIWKNRYEDSMIQNDIYGSFGQTKLCSTEQVAMVLKAEGNPAIVELKDDQGKGTGKFQTQLTLSLTNPTTGKIEKVEGTPKELFKRWIDEDRNLYHQLNNLAAGGGTKTTGGTRLAVDTSNMTPSQKIAYAREHTK